MKKYSKNIKLAFLAIGLTTMLLGLSSCEKFLAEKPSKTSSLVVTNTNQLHALLNNYSSFYSEGNRSAIYSTDHYGLTTDIYHARPSTYSMASVEFALWDTEYLPDDGREVFWSGEFRKIFTANMVLSSLDEVSGSEKDKTELKADAHFIRAYSYFQLANTYCLPYNDKNRDEVGLPLKQSTSFEELAERRPLHEVYALIESDLNEALKTNVKLSVDGKNRHWRANTAGVNGFAARYHLTLGNYQKALEHAEVSLQEYSTLVDYNTEMRYGKESNVNINTGTPEASQFTIQFPYTHDNQSDMTDMVQWKEFLYFRMLSHESWWYIPSQELLDLYDQENDLRYEYHMVEGYSYDRGMASPAYNYPGYVFFFKDRVPSGPTVAEMLLIKAEALARLGKPAEAMSTVNILRRSRMKPGAWVNLQAGTQDEAIKKVLEERRRELPFSQRWFDIRRFNHNDYTGDDVVLSKTFYPYNISSVIADGELKTYTLPADSRRYAAPIPRTEIISSQGVIVQNTY